MTLSVNAEIDGAVARVGQAMGMHLKLDENRACRLVFDGRLAVDIEAPDLLESTLVMTSIVNGGGGLPGFLEIAGFREDKTGFMHDQENVIKNNPIIKEMLSRIQALNERDPGLVPKSMDWMADLALSHVVQIKGEQAGQ